MGNIKVMLGEKQSIQWLIGFNAPKEYIRDKLLWHNQEHAKQFIPFAVNNR